MKAVNKEMSIGTQRFLNKTFVGILWIAIGIVGCFASIAAKIVHIILLLLVIVTVVILMKAKRENDDEMSMENYIKAKAKAGDIMYCVYGALSVLSALIFGLLRNADINWHHIIPYMFFILMGIQDIMIGAFFHRLEAE